MNRRDEEDAYIVHALQEAELRLSSIYDLVNSNAKYPQAIPILINLLPQLREPIIEEGVVRALAVQDARGVAAQPLIDEFKRVDDKYSNSSGRMNLKWAIGNALSVVADDGVFDELVGLLQDKSHGKSREMLALALSRMTNPRAVDILVESLSDEILVGYAIMALGKLKAVQSRPYIEPFLGHPIRWIRLEAARALSKLDRAAQSRGNPRPGEGSPGQTSTARRRR